MDFDNVPPTSVRTGFAHGMAVSLSCNSVLLVWLYAAAAHTQDIRSRIHWLLDGMPGVWVVFVAVGTAAGIAGLLVAGGWSWRAVAAAVVGSFLAVVVLASGIMAALIPAGYESPPRYWLVWTASLLAGISLWRQRARLARVR